MKKVLVPTDFSKNAKNAEHFAAALSRDYNVQIYLLHVMHVPILDVNAPITLADTLMDNERKSTEEQLRKSADTLKEEYSVDVITKSQFGLGSDVISEMAAELDVDFILMGTSGESNLMTSLFGSVSSAVIKNSNIPVLAIPQNAQYSKINLTVFGNDYQDDISSELSFIRSIGNNFSSKIDHISVETRHGNYAKEIIYDNDEGREVSIWSDSVLEGILTYVKEVDADLIALKHHQRGFIQELFQPSTTMDMLKQSSAPLLIFN